MTLPTASANRSNADAGTDNPQLFRADVLDLIDKFNLLIAHFSTFAGTLLDDADAATARATLGVLSSEQTKSVPLNTTALTPGECFSTSAPVTLATGLAVGSTYMIYNNSAAGITITQGAGLTLRVAGSALTGNRTLNQRGLCSVWVLSATEYIISGAGLA